MNERILVVEDEEAIREAIIQYLSDAGFDVVGASSGEEALKIARDGVDLVVTDIRIHGMDGLAVAKRIREQDENIPVIIITGYPSMYSAIEAIRAGIFDYIVKPFRLERLLMSVHNALEKRRLVKENLRLVGDLRQLCCELEEYKEHLEEKVMEMNRELIAASTRLQQIMENISSGIATVSSDGIVRSMNRAGLRILGFEDEREVIGRDCAEIFVTPKDGGWALSSALKNMRSVPYREITLQRRDGEKIYVGAGVAVLRTDSGAPQEAIVIFSDVTEQHKLRERMAELDRLAVVGQLTSAVAHEIKNPLAGLKNIAELLQSQLEEDDPRYKFVGMISHQTDRLAKIVEEMLDFSKPREASFCLCNPRVAVENVLPLIKGRLESQGIELREEWDETLPEVWMDPNQIEQVVLNICLNAIEAMPEGGSFTIRGKKTDAWVELEFCDTGCGIPPENMEKLFSPFFTTKSEGTGLGLSICRRILESHSGTIEVESEVGNGTTVRVRLPQGQVEVGRRDLQGTYS